ncbi:ABC transporter permease [Myroides sp. DF42-4-2]|uniref:ABC transporter permease n=1 Tax=unclassified Myroides TaxID=2642485 RepID=UPI002577140B|nr:ABC transporter permease [Myroides sp. DF42-4-2]MDM1408791.1 ABC transporter permease [Myroides sp. DF42-4-2]
MLNNWFKIYVYNSKKNKVYFLLTILCLAIGITAVLLSSLYLKEEKSFDQWNENKTSIYLVENSGGKVRLNRYPFALVTKLKEDYHVIEDYLMYSTYSEEIVVYKDKEERSKKVLNSSQGFFDFFPYPLVYGTKQSVFQHPNEVVLEQEKAAVLFGKGVNPVGEQLKIKEELYTVVGVYAIGHRRSSFMPEIVLNTYQFLSVEEQTIWDQQGDNLLLKTAKKQETTAAIKALYLKYYYEPWAARSDMSLAVFLKQLEGVFGTDFYLEPLDQLHLQSEKSIASSIPEPVVNSKMLNIILGLSSLMLLLSLFNYVNLALSQTLSRAKEVGVRKVLGGVKRSIIKQSLYETTITVCIAFVLSIFLFLWLLPFANFYLNINIVVQWGDMALLFVGSYFLILLIAGLIPAFYIAQYRVLKVLKGDFNRSRSGSFIKNTFLVIQFAIACWFIVGTYMVYKQAHYMATKDLGFSGDQVISFPFLADVNDGSKAQKYEAFKQEALQIKGVEQVAVAGVEYAGTGGLGSILMFRQEEKEDLVAFMMQADADYFEMMNIQLEEGRFLDRALASDSIQNVLINESLLRATGESRMEDVKLRDITVVGVLRDFHTGGLEYSITPLIFSLPKATDNYFSNVTMKVDVTQMETLAPALEKLWDTFNPEAREPFSYEFVDQKFAKTFEKIDTQKQILLGLSLIVIFIALFGLFAVSSFTIGTRLKEVAIRKVLGASTGELIKKLSYQYLIYCVIGFGVAVYPSYYLLNAWLSDYTYRIEISYDVYVVCLILIVILTLLIVVSRAYQATRVNVLKYIKYE